METNTTIIDTVISNCIANGGTGGVGGAAGPLVNTQGTIGGDGGVPGRAMGAGVYADVGATLTMSGCTLLNNQAIGGQGGDGTDGGYGGATIYYYRWSIFDDHDPVSEEVPWSHTANGGGVCLDVMATGTLTGLNPNNL